MPRITQPKPGEPIRLVQLKSGEWRYEATTTVTAPGQPRRQSRRRFETLKQAREWVQSTSTAARAGTITPTSDVTLAALVEQWQTGRRDIRQTSVQGYSTVLRPIVDQHGDRRVQSITRREIEQWVAEWPTTGGVRGKGWSHRSITYALQALKLVFDHAVQHDLIAKSPAAGVKAPRKTADDHQDFRVWTARELGQFVRTADQDPFAAAWRLTACGLRRSEVLGLDWSGVDFERGTVRVEAGRTIDRDEHTTVLDDPKSAASRRTVAVEALQPGTVKLMREEWMRQGRPTSGLVVVHEPGAPVHPDMYGSRFRAVCQRAGVPPVRLHSVRHTIATVLHEAGEAPAAVARLLGHTVSTHLAFYVTSSDDAALRAAERFGKALAGLDADAV